jgi:protein-S-isoprenylcysteine O-methyltransferase Ste14
MTFLLFVAATASFFVYGLAIKYLFSRRMGVSSKMRLLQILSSVFAVSNLVCTWEFQPQNRFLPIVALSLYVCGLALFASAVKALRGYRLTLAFSPDQPETLVKEGIYRYVRHPFYLSYSLTWLAGIVAAPSAFTAAAALTMIVFYVLAAREEERKFQSSPLSLEYEVYRERAGLLWPRIAGLRRLPRVVPEQR